MLLVKGTAKSVAHALRVVHLEVGLGAVCNGPVAVPILREIGASLRLALLFRLGPTKREG